jgi:hypothetical protein
MMKKIKMTLLAVALMVATVANAQFSWGVQGGVNLSNLSFDQDIPLSVNPKIGFNIGLMADYDFAHNMAIQSGLFFTTKGAKSEREILGNELKTTINLMYLQIPVHFAYKVDVTPGARIVFHGGPYAAYGVGGSHKVNGKKVDDSKIFGDDGYRPFDFGLGIGVGAEFGQIFVGLGWDMGLANISRGDVGTLRNQNAFLTVGYKF